MLNASAKKKVNNIFWVLLLIGDWLTKRFFLDSGHYVLNQGIAFGVDFGRWSEVVVFGALLLLVLWWQKTDNNMTGVRLLMVGGMGNLVDRVLYGQVVDWLMIPGVNLWVNAADLYINLGVAIILVESFVISLKKNGNNI